MEESWTTLIQTRRFVVCSHRTWMRIIVGWLIEWRRRDSVVFILPGYSTAYRKGIPMMWWVVCTVWYLSQWNHEFTVSRLWVHTPSFVKIFLGTHIWQTSYSDSGNSVRRNHHSIGVGGPIQSVRVKVTSWPTSPFCIGVIKFSSGRV